VQFHIVTIGRDRRDDYATLIARYAERLPWEIVLHEKLPKKPNAPTEQRMKEEASLLMSVASQCQAMVALDEQGKQLTSLQFAERIGSWRDSGLGKVAFVIGGADGLHSDILQKATLKLAFGSLTWPHQMVRLMLVEQLYRAHTILEGHPYHRQ
jgi:23S rRNA (pseudouridine1915-N3)-methyltransferase